MKNKIIIGGIFISRKREKMSKGKRSVAIIAFIGIAFEMFKTNVQKYKAVESLIIKIACIKYSKVYK